jgi:serine/threonine protein kinase/tetratricopeptide (TPR) repeat protein
MGVEPMPGRTARGVTAPFQPDEILLDRFRILREVAYGGMGVVYDAFDEKLDRRIAIKCALPGYAIHLTPEVRHASEISHPNVCRLFEIHRASTPRGEMEFVTMEFIEGETLASRLRGEPMDDNEARDIALQLCAGLAEAHRHRVIHGDLKCNNVMLTKSPDGARRAVILDFGLAQRSEEAFAAGGTPGYMAPELLRGEAPSVASDIFALGVILRAMAGSRYVEEAVRPGSEQVSTVTQAPGSEAAQAVVRVPAQGAWVRVISRCLDPRPQSRYSSAEALAEALQPSKLARRAVGIGAAVLLAATAAFVTYQRTTAPVESVRLAMLPFSSQDAGVSETLGRLHGTSKTAYRLLATDPRINSIEKARDTGQATHVLQGQLDEADGNATLHLSLTDTRTQTKLADWSAVYTHDQLRYLPWAAAGVVTSMLHLPVLPEANRVKPEANPDYVAGSQQVRRDSTVDAAMATLARALAADPDSAAVHAAMAEAQWFKYYLTRDKQWLAKSTESLRQAQLRNPDAARVHRVSGILEANAGRYEQAIAQYRRSLEIEPGNADGQRRLGQAYEKINQLELALASFRRAIELEPEYYRNYHALGAFYFQQGLFSEAEKTLAKAVELAPNESTLHYALGSVLNNLGRFSDAERELRISIDQRPSAAALHSLGASLYYQSRDREAIPYFRQALQLNPRSALAWLHLGICHRRSGQVRESEQANLRGLALSEADVAQDPRDGHSRSVLAYLCARLGQRQRAESEIAQALHLSPSDGDTRAMAALTYEALGRRDDAIAVLNSSNPETRADLNRWPDVAGLHADVRFQRLLKVQTVQ